MYVTAQFVKKETGTHERPLLVRVEINSSWLIVVFMVYDSSDNDLLSKWGGGGEVIVRT